MTPVFPLSQAVLPGDPLTLRVFEPRYLAMFDTIRRTQGDGFVTVLIERGAEVGGGERRFMHGVRVGRLRLGEADGHLTVTGTAGSPVSVVRWLVDDPHPAAETADIIYPQGPTEGLQDAASALTSLAQSVRSLLARHGITDLPGSRGLTALLTVASGTWFLPAPTFEEFQTAFWAVARCVPCGPLDRHALLLPDTPDRRVGGLRRTVEHADEVLHFSSRSR